MKTLCVYYSRTGLTKEVEDACPAVKAFLAKSKDKFKGNLCFVLTHMSNLGYEKKIENLQKLI